MLSDIYTASCQIYETATNSDFFLLIYFLLFCSCDLSHAALSLLVVGVSVNCTGVLLAK